MKGFQAYRKALTLRMERAVIHASDRAAQTARGLCPYGDGRDGSHLRDRIFSRTQVQNGVYRGDILADKHYAVYVELGTSRMAARPFLRPAATEHGEEYKRIMEAAMKGKE